MIMMTLLLMIAGILLLSYIKVRNTRLREEESNIVADSHLVRIFEEPDQPEKTT